MSYFFTGKGSSSGGPVDLSGLVPKTTTVNGHQLSTNITITKSDVSLGNVTNDLQLKAADLTTDITLSANSDILIPSEKAIKTYVDTAISDLSVDGGTA